MFSVHLVLLVLIGVYGCASKQSGFERIVFSMQAGAGSLSGKSYTIEINNRKECRLIIEQAYKDNYKFPPEQDTAKQGYYTGALHDTMYQRLIRDLESIRLNDLKFDNPYSLHMPTLTVIIWYNGKRASFLGRYPPTIVKPLQLTLIVSLTQRYFKKRILRFRSIYQVTNNCVI